MAEIRGVNLGGWFVLEFWMKPHLFEGLNGVDETYFSTHHEHPKTALEAHWNTFITKKDFQYLNSIGIKHLRLPIPWWFMGETPYQSALPWMRHAMEWATEYDMHVLLDLHTAPGCQNGFDNGGIVNQLEWHKDQKNIDLTVEKLEMIATTFANYPSFFGIEVLNEPHWTIPLKTLQTFYKKSYEAIRKHTDQLIVFHDGFRPDDVSWKTFFKPGKFKNIAFDIHLYHCFDPKITSKDFYGHIGVIEDRKQMILELESFVRVIVGEWSLGVIHDKFNHKNDYEKVLVERSLASLQLWTFEHAYGWYFWSYKIDRQSHLDWDFKRLVEHGIMPNNYQ